MRSSVGSCRRGVKRNQKVSSTRAKIIQTTARRTARRFAEKKEELRRLWSPLLPRSQLRFLFRLVVLRPCSMVHRILLGSWRNQNERLPLTPPSIPSRNGNCFACGKFGHWRSECPQTQRSGSKGNLSSNRWPHDDGKGMFDNFSNITQCDFALVCPEVSLFEIENFEFLSTFLLIAHKFLSRENCLNQLDTGSF